MSAPEEPDDIPDAWALSRLRAVDIPEELTLSRRLRDELAASAERHSERNPLALLAQIPDMQGAFVSTVMGLEMQLNALRQMLEDRDD
jgi:hypothetical protein